MLATSIEQSEDQVAALVRSARRIAVLGIKTPLQAAQPAYYVPAYLATAGLTILPVPVYYPEVTTLLGERVYRRVAAVPGPIDIVQVFRRAEAIPAHVPDLLAARPRAVWFQSGIRNDAVAAELSAAGILVVQDRCLMVDHRRYGSA